MKILSISSDRKIFEKNSAVRRRQVEFASAVKNLTLIVFSLDSHHLEEFEDGNLKVVPTNSSSRFFYIYDAIKLGRHFDDTQIISTQDPFESGLVGFFLKKPLRARLQVQVHTDFLNPLFRDSFLNFVRYVISLFVIRRADRLRVVSKRIEASIKSKFRKHPEIDVLPVFSDMSRPPENVYIDLHKKYPTFGFIILSVARLEKEKNIKVLLESFAQTLKIAPDVGLVIVGDGRLKDELKKIAHELGIEPRVKFEGWQKNLAGYYKSADLYVSTSNYEGYGLSILEAAYAGLPVISTDVGIMGEILKDNESGLICPVKDVECLSVKMAEMRKFADVRGRIKEGGRLAARSAVMTPENYYKRYVKLWKNCIH